MLLYSVIFSVVCEYEMSFFSNRYSGDTGLAKHWVDFGESASDIIVMF